MVGASMAILCGWRKDVCTYRLEHYRTTIKELNREKVEWATDMKHVQSYCTDMEKTMALVESL